LKIQTNILNQRLKKNYGNTTQKVLFFDQHFLFILKNNEQTQF